MTEDTDEPTDRDGDGDGDGDGDQIRHFAHLATAGDGPAAVAAATVILVRDGHAGAEVLMVRRDSRLSFAGGMWVFPGGRVDDTDYGDDPDDLDRAERRAAARESFEEAGLRVDPASLFRFSHWTPPPQSNKRFSTAFFVAEAPPGRVRIDDGEIRDHRWARPNDVLDAQRASEVELAPPTFITLVQLSHRSSAGDILGAAASGVVEHFSTRVGLVGDRVAALYHGDAGYATTDASIEGPRHRLWMDPAGWVYERDEVTRPR